MSSISNPKVTVNITTAPTAISNAVQKVLMIGQMNTTEGSATPGILVQNIGVSGEEDDLFGRNTMLADMIRNFRDINTQVQVDAVPYDDAASSTAATSTLTIGGTATENGTITVYIQSKTENFKFSVGVSSGSSSTAIATSLFELITGQTDNFLIFNVTNPVNGEVLFTCVHKGTIGNDCYAEVTEIPSGLTASFSRFANGATDPDTSGLSDVIANVRYQTIVYPANYDTTVIQELMDSRWNVTNNVLDGVAVLGDVNSYAGYLSGSKYALNSNSCIVLANKLSSTSAGERVGGDLPELGVVVTSQFAAIRSLFFTTGADVTNYLTQYAVGNTQGGISRAAYPYANRPMPNLPVIAADAGFTSEEQDSLNSKGISFVGNNSSNTEILMGNMVTTYLTNSLGESDSTYHYLNATDTASACREYFFNNNKSRFASSVLTPGTVVGGTKSNQVNIQTIKSWQTTLYTTLSGDGYGLTVAGDDFLKAFRNNVTVTVSDYESGDVVISAYLFIVSQLRSIYETLQISFNLIQ